MGINTRPRLLIADDNISNTGGHFFELASQLFRGGSELGYDGVLATNARFDKATAGDTPFHIVPTFQTRRLVRWSLGVDGRSRVERDIAGRSIGGNWIANQCYNLADRFRPKRNPAAMLKCWANDFAKLISSERLSSSDRVLINTGDDFAMLALAAAMQTVDSPPLNIDVLFHFALYDGQTPGRTCRRESFGQQVRSAVRALAPHEIGLYATTTALADQMRQVGLDVNDVPYPTRTRSMRDRQINDGSDRPFKVVLAGLPRAEKGRAAISELLESIESPLLRSGICRMSMQMPSKRWKRMVPPSLHGDFETARSGETSQLLEVMTNNLAPEAYHQWLDSTDVGLFLYDPNRYVARCSGVLLEMMVRGVPVIVPDGCWLADQVRSAGGNGSIGFVYRDRSEINGLLQRFAQQQAGIRDRCTRHAKSIANLHCGKSTLAAMGLRSVCQRDAHAA